jgi:hypothetical protein
MTGTAVAENRVHASIWLRLPPAQESHLRAVINRLADSHGTHVFQPHLTVCGSTLDETALHEASLYARQSELLPLRVRVAGIACAVGNPFQAVFIEIANSPELLRFREDMRRITSADRLSAPHVSLFYAVGRRHTAIALEARDLEEIARHCRAEAGTPEYLLERPAIVYPGAGGHWLSVPEWRVEDL